MSLVAYAASSDEESENEDNTASPPIVAATIKTAKDTFPTNGHISDEDDDYVLEEEPACSTQKSKSEQVFNTGLGLLNLPKPKNNKLTSNELGKELAENISSVFAKLPMPKVMDRNEEIIEEDDEFLHKKSTLPSEIQKPPPPTAQSKVPVKITIPSVKDFTDVDEDIAKSVKKKVTPANNAKRSGLLTMLPKAKSEQNFAKTDKQQVTTESASGSKPTNTNPLIPDTVRNRRPAHNTEGVDGIQTSKQLPAKISTLNQKKMAKISLVEHSDSEASDDESGDFFSLNDDEKLPEVNANELSVMVAKRAAKMVETTTKYLEASAAQKASENQETEHNEEDLRQAQKRYHESQLNEKALQALVGGSAKRRRQQRNEIEIVDISSNQILPDRQEWMRTALASQTTYQPTGVLVDEEPAAGTRRKHQITYLAHKAKANEAELQAMWSANRQNRRATQSKYGF